MNLVTAAFAAFNVVAVCLDAISTHRYVPTWTEANPLARWLFVWAGKARALQVITATVCLYSLALTFVGAPWSYLCCALLGIQGWLHMVAAHVNTFRSVPPTGRIALLIMFRLFNAMSKVRFGRN